MMDRLNDREDTPEMLFGLMDRWMDEKKDGHMKLFMRYRRTLFFF